MICVSVDHHEVVFEAIRWQFAQICGGSVGVPANGLLDSSKAKERLTVGDVPVYGHLKCTSIPMVIATGIPSMLAAL